MRYRTKPREIHYVDALKWTGENNEEIRKFCSTVMGFSPNGLMMSLRTTSGPAIITTGDYVIRDGAGYAMARKRDFERVYEEAPPVDISQFKPVFRGFRPISRGGKING